MVLDRCLVRLLETLGRTDHLVHDVLQQSLVVLIQSLDERKSNSLSFELRQSNGFHVFHSLLEILIVRYEGTVTLAT